MEVVPCLTKMEKKLGVRMNPGELVLPTLGQLAASVEERIRTGATAPASKGLMRKLLDAIRGTVAPGETR